MSYRLLVAHSYVSDSCSLSSHGHFDNRNSNYPKHVVHFLQGDWLNVGLNKFCKKVALLIRGGNAFMKSLVILTAPHLDFDTLLNSYIWAKTQTGRIFLLECHMFADDVIPTWAFRDSAMSWAPVTSSMAVRRQQAAQCQTSLSQTTRWGWTATWVSLHQSPWAKVSAWFVFGPASAPLLPLPSYEPITGANACDLTSYREVQK